MNPEINFSDVIQQLMENSSFFRKNLNGAESIKADLSFLLESQYKKYRELLKPDEDPIQSNLDSWVKIFELEKFKRMGASDEDLAGMVRARISFKGGQGTEEIKKHIKNFCNKQISIQTKKSSLVIKNCDIKSQFSTCTDSVGTPLRQSTRNETIIEEVSRCKPAYIDANYY